MWSQCGKGLPDADVVQMSTVVERDTWGEGVAMNQEDMAILLVGNDGDFSRFDLALAICGAEVTCCGEGRSAGELICENNYAAVAVDANLTDGKGLDFVRRWAKEYPLTNFALVSDMAADDFHEATEGLGLFMQIAPGLDEKEAERMLELLSKIHWLMG